MHSVVYSKSARQNVRSPATRQSRAYPNNFGSPRSGSYAENRIIMSPVTNKPRTPTIMNTPSTTALTTINRSMSPSTIDSPDFDDIQQYIGRFGLSDITTKTPARNNRLTTVSSNLLSKFNAL